MEEKILLKDDEDGVLKDNQDGLLEDNQDGLPEDKQNSLQEDKQNSHQEDKQDGLLEDDQDGLQEDKQNGLQEDKQNGLQEDKQDGFPEDNQGGPSEDNQGGLLDIQGGLSEDNQGGLLDIQGGLLEDNQCGLLDIQGGLLDDQDGLLVIGAGLPRTGALSLKHALSQLYIGKCYHMMDILRGDQEDIDIWWDAAEGNVSKEKWQTYFRRKHYTTGVDFPFALFYKELMDCFPNAKVILSTREPDSWYSSVHNSIFQMTKLLRDPSYSLLLKWMDGRKRCGREFIDKLDDKIPDGCDVTYYTAISGGPEQAKKFYMDWEEAVKRKVPASRLLIHSADDGWEPLCRFLGFPIPDTPYPRVDDRASIQKATKNLQRLHAILFYILPISIALIGFLLKGHIISLLSFFFQIVEKMFL